MSLIIKKLKRIYKIIFEAGTFTVGFKKLWNKIFKKIDLIISIVPRLIMKYSSKVEDNKIFFHTQENVYVCNPKYITEELLRRNEDVNIVWRGNNYYSSRIPHEVKVVKYNKMEYFKELYSSKIIVTNSSLFVGIPVFIKRNQILVETWHGSLGLKKWSKNDVKDSFQRIFALEKTGKMTTFCISNSELEDGSMRATYWPNTPIYRLGHARNDVFFKGYNSKRKEIKAQIFEDYNIPKNTKIVMYAPTFRDMTGSLDYLNIDYKKVIKALEKKFGGKWIFFVRMHPSLRKRSKELGIKNNQDIINVTGYPDMQELAAITDVAITDYSSWIYDFVLSRKPGFIFATDIEEYESQDRGFYYPITETPFSISTNSDELVNNILSFDKKTYVAKVEDFLLDKGCVDDGNASKRIVDKLLEILKEKE